MKLKNVFRTSIAFVITAIFLFANTNSQANHIVGADISYVNVGVNQYKFTLVVYRDCSGEQASISYTLNYNSVSCANGGSFTVKPVGTPVEVGPSCLSQKTVCQGGTNLGIQKIVYEGVVSLPQKCNDWIISWNPTGTFRNNAITNIANAGSSDIYIESKLNNNLSTQNNNSSPQFSGAGVAYLSTNQLNVINPGVTEVDGDVLVYKLVTPKVSSTKNVTYLSPFSAINPVTSSPALVLKGNGSIQLTPTKQEVSVTSYVVEEYRNGILVGSAMRDFQIITKDNLNKNPILSGIDNGSVDSLTVCAGDRISFTMHGTDLDITQKLKMTWNNGVEGANFSVLGNDSLTPIGSFTWNTPKIANGNYTFTVKLDDDNCPITGTVSKTYKILVRPFPNFNLPNDTLIKCTDLKNLQAYNLTGSSPYTYLWSTSETTPSITVGAGKFWLELTDKFGCKNRDSISVTSGVVADFSSDSLCTNSLAVFKSSGLSFSKTGAVINNWEWEFGDTQNNTSILQDTKHQYLTEGFYFVKLKVTDEDGCKGDTTKRIKICSPPIPDFKYLDSCKRKSSTVPFNDLTSVTSCGISKYKFDFKSLKTGKSDSLILNYSEYLPGQPTRKRLEGWKPSSDSIYQITMTATNINGCKASVTKTMFIRPQPYVNLRETSFIARCDMSADTTLLAMDTMTVKKWKTSANMVWQPLQVSWSPDGPNNVLTKTIPLNKSGVYSVKVTDQFGCDSIKSVTVSRAITPSIGITSYYCKKGDTTKLVDNSKSSWGIVKKTWNFGDGSPDLVLTGADTSVKSLYHIYAVNGLYKPKITIVDKTGCTDSMSISVYNNYLEPSFSVAPSPVCVGTPVNLKSRKGLFIDTLYWDLGDGTKINVGKKSLVNDVDNKPIFKSTHKYTSYGNGLYTVTLRTYYNGYYCYQDDTAKVVVFPELKVEIRDPVGLCADAPTTIKGVRTSGNPITEWNWKFSYQDSKPPFTKTVLDSIKETVTDITGEDLNIQSRTFTKNGNHYATLKVKNTDGCEYTVDEQNFRILKFPIPKFCASDSCATNGIQFNLFCNDNPEVEITKYTWVFGDGAIDNSRNPIHTYALPNKYDVSVKIENSRYQCSKDTTIPVIIKQVADSRFKADTVCWESGTQFTNLSKALPDDEIIAWKWHFGNGDSSTAESPTKIYNLPGKYAVSLTVKNKQSGCYKTYIDTVFVKPKPIAGFTLDYQNVVAQKPIQFTDSTQLFPGDFITKYQYTFGDNSAVNAENSKANPIHTYQFAGIYNVKQIVTNQYGCSDEIEKPIDLNIRLLFPTGFSPNGDGLNDVFKAIFRGIASIDEIKLYNRWGELIWEANGDKEAAWDGTYNGVEQPMGVYVYYVKAKSFLNEDVIKQGKVTIIR